jgi:hypothetical protein
MAIASDFTISTAGDIRYVGAAHGNASAGYYTVIEFHRWLADLADDAVALATSSDFLDITFNTPSERQTDNIIQLINSYNIDQTAAEHLYDGSVIQNSGSDIWDGLVVIANQGMNLQIIQNGAILTNDFWNYDVKGTHTGTANATVLTDSSKTWTTNQWLGFYIENTTDGSWGVIASNTSNTITLDSNGLQGGTENDFDTSDAYRIITGLNADPVSGYSHRFMLKVRTSGTDIDGRRLIGQTRVWGKSFSEFRIGTGTARGNNVLALTYATDLNNQKLMATIEGYTSIANTSEGYNAIDVNADSTDEYFFSKYNANKPTNSINDFYERMKWLTMQGSTESLYGLDGDLFRGITHQVAYTSLTGTFDDSNVVSWTGASAGTGQVIADNGTNTMWIQLLTGNAPVATVSLSQSAPDAASATAGTVTERTLSFPFCGQSTGSALIGGYGVGLQTDDLTASDKLTALDGIVYTPPNVQNFYVTGLVSTEDYVLVGPYDGVGDFEYDQLSLNTTLNTDNITSVVVTTSIPSDTPTSGYIRVADDDGVYRRLHYSSWTGSTFTIDTTDGNEDFGVGKSDATSGNNVFIAYIDKLATGTSETYQATYATDRNLWIRVRDGGVDKNNTPIKTFESQGTFGSAGGTSTVIRTPDY